MAGRGLGAEPQRAGNSKFKSGLPDGMKAACQGKKTVFLFFFPDPGVELGSPASQADSLLCEPPEKP